jgi:hypothetical protein
MIGKIVKGSGFRGCVNYVMDKKQAVLLHAEGVLAEDKESIIRSFLFQREMNPRISKPVGHIALSYSKEDADKLTDEKMVSLAKEYLHEMKITDTQYIIVRHQDREHPHVHIVFNRIDNNGKTISDKNDLYRNEQVCKKLKAKHGLTFGKGKEQVKQHRLKGADKVKYEIYSAIVQELPKSPDWKQFEKRLAANGIDIRFKYKGQTDEVQGVSFAKGDYLFKGSEIDRSFSYGKLNRQLMDNSKTVAKEQAALEDTLRQTAGNVAETAASIADTVGGLFDMHPQQHVDDTPPYDPYLQKKKKKRRYGRQIEGTKICVTI